MQARAVVRWKANKLLYKRRASICLCMLRLVVLFKILSQGDDMSMFAQHLVVVSLFRVHDLL